MKTVLILHIFMVDNVSTTKDLFRAYDVGSATWWYAYGCNIEHVIPLFRACILKKIGRCKINRIEKRKDGEKYKWHNLQLPNGFTGI